MRKGVIDLGTNTFNLLIADVFDQHFEVVHSAKNGVALGMGGINQSIITEDAIGRALIALTDFKTACDLFNVQSILAFGTSAIRDASNSIEFIHRVKEQTGISVEIIDGTKEAELIYHGVKWTYNFEEPAVIMDIGGGSTEFIFSDKNGIRELISLNIGVSRIFQEFTFNDPLSVEDVKMIEQWLETKSNGFFDNKREDCLLGASGSFETFYELMYNEPYPVSFGTQELNVNELKDSLKAIISSTQKERDENQWIIPIRKKMAPIAAIKTNWIMQKLQTKRVLISPFSLKEGALTYAI
jgi:exopolyphosphatase/guanosine-5'-triphosphate,3'-diphosphate pyrophosphatase